MLSRTDYHNLIAFTIMSGRIVIISRVTNCISMHHETGIRFNGRRDRASVRARISKSELFPMKCSYYQFQGGPRTRIHGFHFQRAAKAERWLRYVEMYTYYVHVYIHAQTDTHTHARIIHVAISRASVTRREIYGFERERSEDGRK